jgi:hypothetical protein
MCPHCRINPRTYDDETGGHGSRCATCARLTGHRSHTHTGRYTDDNRPAGLDNSADPDHTWETTQVMSPYFRHQLVDEQLVIDQLGYLCDGPDGCGYLERLGRTQDDQTPAPRLWTEPHSVPDVQMLDGRLHHDYGSDCVETDLGAERWQVTYIEDPRSGNIAVVRKTSIGAELVLRYVDGRIERNWTTWWAWEAVTTGRHVLACEAFRQARRVGRLTPYWTTNPSTVEE